MYKIYVDDVRECPKGFNKYCQTTNDTLHAIRKEYKSGERKFYLDLDHDAGTEFATKGGGDYINILKSLEDLQRSGKMTNCEFYVNIHSFNPVGRHNMQAYLNGPWFHEVRFPDWS